MLPKCCWYNPPWLSQDIPSLLCSKTRIAEDEIDIESAKLPVIATEPWLVALMRQSVWKATLHANPGFRAYAHEALIASMSPMEASNEYWAILGPAAKDCASSFHLFRFPAAPDVFAPPLARDVREGVPWLGFDELARLAMVCHCLMCSST